MHAPDFSSSGADAMPWPKDRGRGESKTSPRRIEAKLRAAAAMRLRVSGATYAAIARRLGFRDPSGAWRAIDRALVATLPRPRPWPEK
jgi:transposase-like protein